MKYLPIIILVALFSCSDKETCQECTQTSTIEITGAETTTETVNLGIHCEEELDNFKKLDGKVNITGTEIYQVKETIEIECK